MFRTMKEAFLMIVLSYSESQEHDCVTAVTKIQCMSFPILNSSRLSFQVLVENVAHILTAPRDDVNGTASIFSYVLPFGKEGFFFFSWTRHDVQMQLLGSRC